MLFYFLYYFLDVYSSIVLANSTFRLDDLPELDDAQASVEAENVTHELASPSDDGSDDHNRILPGVRINGPNDDPDEFYDPSMYNFFSFLFF